MYTLSIMILSYLYSKIFLQQISKFCLAAVFLFQAKSADRPGRPAPAQDMHACACLSADRPGRPTESSFALGFSGSTARSTAFRKLCFCLEEVDRPGRPESNGNCPQGGRSTGRVDRQACKSPTALSSFVQF